MDNRDFVNKKNRPVVPIRIREARISRGLSLSDLAERIDVTKQAVSKYELGTSSVNSSTLLKISEVLDFPIDFFFKVKEDNGEIFKRGPVFFRSTATAKKIKDALEQKIEFIHEIIKFLKVYIDFPKIDILNLPDSVAFEFYEDEIIEEIAMKLREYWDLGDGPIKNLASLLQKKGFIISRVEFKTMKVDAYSRWIEGTPYIILGSDKESAARARFTLAHELGHLILHQHIEEDDLKKNHKQIEYEANRFASALLLPAQSFSKELYGTSLDDLVFLKQKWKVSIAAMIRRCYDLDLITEQQYSNMNRYLNIKKWKTKEPLDDLIEFEKPNMMSEAFDLLVENNIIPADDIINALSLNADEIENLCFIEPGYFKKHMMNSLKPNIRIIK